MGKPLLMTYLFLALFVIVAVVVSAGSSPWDGSS
jgi:hypothetical protein